MDLTQAAPTLLPIALFVLVHLYVDRLDFLFAEPRSGWLSVAGGAAVAFVFLYLLPELGSHQTGVGSAAAAVWPGLQDAAIYLVAMAGLVVFYGLERHVKMSRSVRAEAGLEDHPAPRALWLHATLFALYNASIGYLLIDRESSALPSTLSYAMAMALHLLVVDHGLVREYHQSYHRKARWLFAAATVGGWMLGLLSQLPDLVVGVLFAFLAGAMVLNSLKEELPDERRSRWLPFLSGVVGYSALLLLLGL